jgi:hypothetical protein
LAEKNGLKQVGLKEKGNANGDEASPERDANAPGWMAMIMMMLLRKGRSGTIDGEQAKGPNG